MMPITDAGFGHWRRPAAVLFEQREVALDGTPAAAYGRSLAEHLQRPAAVLFEQREVALDGTPAAAYGRSLAEHLQRPAVD